MEPVVKLFFFKSYIFSMWSFFEVESVYSKINWLKFTLNTSFKIFAWAKIYEIWPEMAEIWPTWLMKNPKLQTHYLHKDSISFMSIEIQS